MRHHHIHGCATRLLLVLLLATAAEARVKSNSQLALPNALYLADLDGAAALDGRGPGADLVQVAGNRLLAFRADFEASPILHSYFTARVRRLVIGDFTNAGREHGRDQVCADLEDGTFPCFAISDDTKSLWWWFTQGTFFTPDEDTIVGDFDGDGADDILVYNRTTGGLRMYTRMITGVFAPMPGFALGNLGGADLVNKQLRAGEFGQAAGRDDLLVFDPAAGLVSRYDAVTDAAGLKTFWWAFTAWTGGFGADDQLLVANLDGGTTDGVVLRSPRTGAYRMYRALYSGGYMSAVSNVALGQLPIRVGGRAAFAPLKSYPWEPGARRSDALLFDTSRGDVTRTEARWDGRGYTYWWAFSRATPANAAGTGGWSVTPIRHNWLLLLCKFSDRPLGKDGSVDQQSCYDAKSDIIEPPNVMTDAMLKQALTAAGSGTGNVVDYFRDVSYGKLDVGATVRGWYTMGVTWAEMQRRFKTGAWLRGDVITACIDAARTAGLALQGYERIITYTAGSSSIGADGVGPTTRVSLDPCAFLYTFAHEMGHHYGLWDSYDDKPDGVLPDSPTALDVGTGYGDRFDVMGNLDFRFTGAVYGSSGPELNGPARLKLGFLPANRVRILMPATNGQWSGSIRVAALNRPEADGALLVKIPVRGDSTDHYYAIELRQKSGWDQNIPQHGVLIHEWVHGLSSIKTNPGPLAPNQHEQLFLAGDGWHDGKVWIVVEDVAADGSTASEQVWY